MEKEKGRERGQARTKCILLTAVSQEAAPLEKLRESALVYIPCFGMLNVCLISGLSCSMMWYKMCVFVFCF